ncbi:MAG: hypothetical protein NTW08_02800 [Gammaproteobacteria bacterium]|nr:hypothetical protein [Gammaproteobacteria bacterium]
MLFILTDHAQSVTFDSLDALLVYLIHLEQSGDAAQLRMKLKLSCDGVSDEEIKPLFPFLLSQERRLAFDIEILGLAITPFIREVASYSYFVQSQRLNELRLLPRVVELTAQPTRLRRAKVNLVRGSGRGQSHINFQHQQQQQQQQQMAVQAKRTEPKPLLLSADAVSYTAEADLSELITAATIEDKLGGFWESLPYSEHCSVLDAWEELVGIKDAITLDRMQFTAPMVHAVQLDAMKMILSHFPEFMGGVVAHHLPEGFFWVRHPDATWVLCFDPINGKQYRDVPVNPLTIRCQMPNEHDSRDGVEEDNMPAHILKLRVFKKGPIQESLTEDVYSHYDQLCNPDATDEQIFKALSYFISLLDDKIAPEIVRYCDKKLKQVSDALIQQDRVGLVHALLTHGVTGVVVLLTQFETLIDMADQDALTLFRSVFLLTPESYSHFLQLDTIAVFDGFSQLGHEDLRWWWHGLKTQSTLVYLKQPDFKTEVRAYQYFLGEAQSIMGRTKLPWGHPQYFFPTQPLKNTWNRALLILQRAAFPEEQFKVLTTLRFDQWGAYYASYQQQYRLLAGAMQVHLKPNFKGDYRVERLSSWLTSDEYDVYFSRYIGMHQWRAGSWEDYLLMKDTLVEWMKEHEIPLEKGRPLQVLLLCLTTGKRAFVSAEPFEDSIKHALRAFSHLTRHGYDLTEVLERVAVYLLQLEAAAVAGRLILAELTRGLSLWVLISQSLLSCGVSTGSSDVDNDGNPLLNASSQAVPTSSQAVPTSSRAQRGISNQIDTFLSLFVEHGQETLPLFEAIQSRQEWDEQHPESAAFSWPQWMALRQQLSAFCGAWSVDESTLCIKLMIFFSQPTSSRSPRGISSQMALSQPQEIPRGARDDVLAVAAEAGDDITNLMTCLEHKPTQRRAILHRLTHLDLSRTNSLFNTAIFDDLVKELSIDQPIEQAFSKALPKELVLSEPDEMSQAAILDNEGIHFLIKNNISKSINRLKEGQVVLKTWRPILPMLFQTSIELTKVRLEAIKEKSKIQEILIDLFKEQYEFIFEKGSELIRLFSENPYDLSILEPTINTIFVRLNKIADGKLWGALKLAVSAFTYLPLIDRTVMKSLNYLFPEEQHNSPPDFSRLFRCCAEWFLSLPQKKDFFLWLKPTLESVFAVMKWYETTNITFTQERFEEGLVHLNACVKAMEQVIQHPMHKKSLLDLLIKTQKRFKDSHLQHTFAVVIALLKGNQLSTLLELAVPFMRAYWDMLLVTGDDVDRCYVLMASCEREWLKFYQILMGPSYDLAKIIHESVMCADAQKRKELSEKIIDKDSKEKLSEPEQKKQFSAYKEQLERDLSWWRQPTESCALIFSPLIEQWLGQSLKKMVMLLALPDEVDTFDVQLVQHYLGNMDVTLPLHASLKQFQGRYDQLRTLMVSLHTHQSKLKTVEFKQLMQIVLNYYERGGQLEAGIQLLELFPFYQDQTHVILSDSEGSPPASNAPICKRSFAIAQDDVESYGQQWVIFFKALCDSVIANKLTYSTNEQNCFTYAISQLKQAFLDKMRPADEDARHRYDLQRFEASFSLHPLLKLDKLNDWKALPQVDQPQLESLVRSLVNGLLQKTLEEDVVKSMMVCLDAHIEGYPDVVTCLHMVMQTPALQACWLQVPKDKEQAQAWLGLMIALKEQQLTADEWVAVTGVLTTCSWEKLQQFTQPFAYRPYPSKTRYLKLISSTDDAYQTKLLADMEYDPVWASTPFVNDEDAPKRGDIVQDDARIDAAVDALTSILDPMLVTSSLRNAIKEQAKSLIPLMNKYRALSRASLSKRQLKHQRAIRKETLFEVSESRLKWLALTSVIMSKTTGTTIGILPNSTQLIVVLLSWQTKGNVLFQLNTGEGKSFVTALLAAWEWVCLGTVDVMSSNLGLIYQDYRDKGIRHFFTLLQIPSRLLLSGKEQHHQPGYIYYTTPWDRAFIASQELIAEFSRLGLGPTQDRMLKTACIADECDLLLLKLLVTFDYVRSKHGENHLQWIYPIILDFIALPAFRQTDKTDNRVWSKKKDEVELRRHMANQPLSDAQRSQWEKISSDDRQLNRWITAACEASQRLHYLIAPQEQRVGYHAGVPVVGDVPQIGAEYSHAVHCFLHLLLQREFKHRCFDIPEEVSALDTNYPLGLASLYDRFIGLSATLGPQAAQQFLHSKLGVSSYILAPHVPSQLNILPRQLCADADMHARAIAARVHASSKGASYLIIEDEAEDVEALHRRLQPLLDSDKYTIQTVIGNEDAVTLQAILLEAEKPNVVTMCTSLFSRGKDLHPMHKLVSIVACFKPKDNEAQGWGRAGRFGQEGEACTIIDASRYEFESVLTASIDVQTDYIRQRQDRLSQDEAVERYYTEESALRRAGALSWFDEGAHFLLRHGQTDQMSELSRQLLSFRQKWIEEMGGIWDDMLEDTDPDCLYTNVYVRRNEAGLLDISPLEAGLKQYPVLLQKAWEQFKQDLLKMARPFLRLLTDDVHAEFQEKWLFEVQDLQAQIDMHQRSKTKVSTGPVLQHTGFGYREEGYTQIEPDTKPSYARKIGFFNTWRSQLDSKHAEIERVMQDLSTIEAQPFPWQLTTVLLPPILQQALTRVSQFEDTERQQFEHPMVDAAVRTYQVMRTLTWDGLSHSAQGEHPVMQMLWFEAKTILKQYAKLDEKIALSKEAIKIQQGEYHVLLTKLRDLRNAQRQTKSTLKTLSLGLEIVGVELGMSSFKDNIDNATSKQLVLERDRQTLNQQQAILIEKFTQVQQEHCRVLQWKVTEALTAARDEAIQNCRHVAKTLQPQMQEKRRQYEAQQGDVATIQKTETHYQEIEHWQAERCVMA